MKRIQFVRVSGALSPRVAYALRRTDTQLDLAVEVETPSESAPAVAVGIAAATPVTLGEKEGKALRRNGTLSYAFSVAASRLVADARDWEKLRLGIAVRWAGGPNGTDRQRERYRHTDARAPHAGLSSDAGDWAPLDLTEHESFVADRRSRIAVPLEQAQDGKLTVVIEDEKGKRIRNLVSGIKAARGPHSIERDGLSDEGNLVEPGTYAWRSVHHPGIEPEYLFSFANGDEQSIRPFGPNHNLFQHAAANEQYAFLAAPSTEGGNSIIAVDEKGALVRAYDKAHGTGLHEVAIAADEKWLYAANDGPGWGQNIDTKQPDWKAAIAITLSRYEVQTGRLVEFPGGGHFARPVSYEYGPGSGNPHMKGTTAASLCGMALLGDTLYISARHAQGVIKVDAATAMETGTIDLPEPGAVTAAHGSLYAVSGKRVVRIDPASGLVGTVIRTAAEEPRGLAVDAAGKIYVSDGTTHTVKIFSPQGAYLTSLGTPGGPYAGKYDLNRMINPKGLAVFGNSLWVTEDRRNPKRAVLWDLGRKTVVFAKYGNPPYGSPAGSFDVKDHTRWLGLRCQWKLDSAQVKVDRGGDWYHVKVLVPLADIGLQNPGGKTLKADWGVLYGDPDGTQTGLRSYWSNQATMLVSDVPGEIMLFPSRWGTARFGE